MKTLREEIVELLMKRIGVVENEEFKGKGINGKYHTFKFAYGELFIKYNDKWHNTMLGGFIEDFEDYEFKVIPFKPKIGDKYWWVEVDGKVCSDISERGCTFDCMAMAIGNCFRTKESAEAHKEEILKILKGENDE